VADVTVIPWLAACGLLYAMAATDPNLPPEVRNDAAMRVEYFVNIARNTGVSEPLILAVGELAAELMRHPDNINRLATEVGPTCIKLSEKS
jgi:hypothetical protein